MQIRGSPKLSANANQAKGGASKPMATYDKNNTINILRAEK